MSIKKLSEDKTMRVRTTAGLDIRLFNDSLEVELDRMPFGAIIELADARSSIRAIAPLGAYYIIRFYKPITTTGGSGRVNEAKSILPGAIYLSKEGVVIRGSTPVLSGAKESIIDYKDRLGE